MAPMGPQDELTGDQVDKVSQLRKNVESLVQANSALTVYCARQHTYVRYLRARQWDVERATKMMKDCLQWRLQYEPHRIMFSDVRDEAESGKLVLLDWHDKRGNAMVVMTPRLQNTTDTEQQMRYLVYIMERASQRTDSQGSGKITWLVDFEGYTLKNAPSLDVCRRTLAIVQNFYPERLGAAVCHRAPRLFEVTWKALQPFIDPVTRRKVVFLKRAKRPLGVGGLLKTSASSDSFAPDDGEASTQDESQLGQQFDLDQLHTSFGGRNTNQRFSIDAFEQWMMREDVQRDVELAGAMAAAS